MAEYPSPEDLKGVVQGTLLYLFLYGFVLIPFQSFSKFYIIAQKKKEMAKAKKDGTALPPKQKNFALKVKYYNTDDWLALMGDRAVGNTLEQGLVFLPLLWIHAIFVDPTKSWTIALLYSVSRGIYPIMYAIAFGYGVLPALGLSTGPGYLVCLYLMYQIATRFAFA